MRPRVFSQGARGEALAPVYRLVRTLVTRPAGLTIGQRLAADLRERSLVRTLTSTIPMLPPIQRRSAAVHLTSALPGVYLINDGALKARKIARAAKTTAPRRRH